MGQRLEEGVRSVIEDRSYPLCFQRVGSMFCLYFREGPVRNFEDARASDTGKFARFFHGMLNRGVYLAPSQFEAGFLSLAHTEDDVDRTLEAGKEALKEAFGG
jgi:glutamate-1-semialdehyde 2,1-aminomutase